MDNPLLTIRFDVPFDRIQAEHVEPAVNELLADAYARIETIASEPGNRTYDNTMEALERASERLEYAMGVVGHLEAVATNPALRAAYNAVRPKAGEFWSRLPLNEGLWNAIRAFSQTREAQNLEGARKRFLEKTMDEFRRHGAELDSEGKKRLEAIDIELTKLTTRFSQNVLDSTNEYELVVDDPAKLEGLPASAREEAHESAARKGREGWRFTLQAPSVIAVLTYAEDAKLREEIWRAFNTRATRGDKDNRPVLARIIALRKEKAKLLGFTDFADLVLQDRMARNGARARQFVRDLQERALEAFERENAELLAFRRELDGDPSAKMNPWDVGFYAEKQRKALYDYDEEALRPYFAADNALQGLFEVAQRLYEVRITPRDVPTWSEGVRAYAIRDLDGRMIAAFYADLFPRESKRDGAWMNGLITGTNGAPQLGLFCANVHPPVGNKPALLTHREVETLFHEFGHLLHHAFNRVDVRSLGGTQVAWDFVELPSQIMENWCWEREALDLFAQHYETRETLPEPIFNRMQRAKTYRAANAMMRQLGFAAMDLALHCDYDPARDGDVMEFAKRVFEDYSAVPLPNDYAMLASFQHLFGSPVGYAAGYYSYKWAEVLDADAFDRFRREGIFNANVGRAFRECILARGDSSEPLDLFRAFIGREPTVDALLVRAGLARAA